MVLCCWLDVVEVVPLAREQEVAQVCVGAWHALQPLLAIEGTAGTVLYMIPNEGMGGIQLSLLTYILGFLLFARRVGKFDMYILGTYGWDVFLSQTNRAMYQSPFAIRNIFLSPKLYNVSLSLSLGRAARFRP